jgi:hypothetical protein
MDWRRERASDFGVLSSLLTFTVGREATETACGTEKETAVFSHGESTPTIHFFPPDLVYVLFGISSPVRNKHWTLYHDSHLKRPYHTPAVGRVLTYVSLSMVPPILLRCWSFPAAQSTHGIWDPAL